MLLLRTYEILCNGGLWLHGLIYIRTHALDTNDDIGHIGLWTRLAERVPL